MIDLSCPAQPGDLLCISYYDPDPAQAGIALVEGVGVEHVAGSQGGRPIVQACVSGEMLGDVGDYMIRGNCDITIRRRIGITPRQQVVAAAHALERVRRNTKYSFIGCARLGLILLARLFKLRGAALFLVRILPDKWFGGLDFCSEARIDDLVYAHVMPQGTDPDDWSPSDVYESPLFETIAVWRGSKMAWEPR